MILVMLIGVLVAGTVEAGDWLIKEDGGKVIIVCEDQDGPLDVRKCRVTPEFQSIANCEQRMQAAMRAMDEEMKTPLARQQATRMKTLIVILEPSEQWNATMKECVHNSK